MTHLAPYTLTRGDLCDDSCDKSKHGCTSCSRSKGRTLEHELQDRGTAHGNLGVCGMVQLKEKKGISTVDGLLRHAKDLKLGSLLAGLQVVSDQGALRCSVLGLDGTLSLELLLCTFLLGIWNGYLLSAGSLLFAKASS